MHMQGEPKTMQQAPAYNNLLLDIQAFLRERVQALLKAGVDARRLMMDPGLGFGKTPVQNYQLLNQFNHIDVQGLPWLIGVSRKSMIGHVVNRPSSERLAGSLAAALAAVARGAAVVRVHDVAETVDALNVWRAVHEGVPE
jgi:dihydropteroate synthase